MTVGTFVGDVARRVFRFDKALAVTFWRMLREPGQLVQDYLAGRRQRYLDPIQYFRVPNTCSIVRRRSVIV